MKDRSTDGAINLIDELRTDAKLGKSKHFNASRRKICWHNWIGIPVIVINVFVGTVIVALLSDGDGDKRLAIASAILAFIAASLSAMQTFFNFHKAAEGHSSVGNRYLKISRNCKKLLRKHQDIPFPPENLWHEVEAIQSEYLEINIEAEAFPTNDGDLKRAREAQEITPFMPNGDELKT
ncbi:SLATT domain-containing protein [Microbulbifer sp. TRSA002]|uniref:SLATT domain-containing protein n=1 Tax=Microbulbifer sp. TRSA002 TaxID=3243382 RepID=UPI00403988DD